MNSFLETCQQWIWASRGGTYPRTGRHGGQLTKQLPEQTPWAAGLVAGQASPTPHNPRATILPGPSSSDTSEVQTARFFWGVYHIRQDLGEADLKGVWVIFRALPSTAVQWLLCIRLAEATQARVSVTSLTRTVSKWQKGDRARENHPAFSLLSAIVINFQGSGEGSGLLVWVLECWVLESDTHHEPILVQNQELVIIALIPIPMLSISHSHHFQNTRNHPHIHWVFLNPLKNHTQNEGL